MIDFDVLWLASAFIVTLAAMLQGITGFGFALIAIPLLLLVYDSHTAVILNMMISLVTLSVLTFRVRSLVKTNIVKNLFLGSILGIPIGIFIHLHFDVELLKLAIGIVTALSSLIMLVGFTVKMTKDKIWQTSTGIISGILTGSISMPGPPVILLLNNQKLLKDHFRATTSAFFVLAYLVSLFSLTSIGAVDLETFILSGTLIPFAILGGFLGYIIFPKVPQEKFQQGVSILVLATALYAVITALG
ncbi:sulfite exporter TauE/SafE family protein [Desulforamulus aquiferis]|uniref:Probable membrane transporter protein n=1 Tax=Desulforamulus aquiferis TaxID=1397668 RepID=A0AAW7ZE99_9FIRM|nr:sulfite exporter TauE/SafE family protein [Desulforamulus aquiferis]MDO7787692.1 sulfite exporter TauE/SafE family protein [Desulforamulus aquiferis]RYD05924.1 hypothetical protein N752_06680 [Desulforamulus aquiferis]